MTPESGFGEVTASVGSGLTTPRGAELLVELPLRTPDAVNVTLVIALGRTQLMAPKLEAVSLWLEGMYTVVALRVPPETARVICICPELGLGAGLL